MKSHKILLLVALVQCTIALNAQQVRKVLFIGNSYTSVNNLPATVAAIATSLGDTLRYDSNAPGGATFAQHSQNATTLQKITAGGWNMVVLQAQSQEPSFPPSQVATQTYPYAAFLDSLINATDSCTETVFYQTWGRKNGDQSNCGVYPPLCTYIGMQDRLTTSYREMAYLNNATASPAGEAWRYVIQNYPGVELYQSDESHPSVAGTYLTACVFYEVLFQKSVLSSSYAPGGITAGLADTLRQSAHTVVRASFSDWFGSGNIVLPSFTTTVTNDSVMFSNTSLNARWYQWNFGDGTQSADASPTHIYTTGGNYTVQLTVGGLCTTATVSAVVNVPFATAIADNNIQALMVLPNPSSDGFMLKGEGSFQQLRLLDVTGEVVYSSKSVMNRLHQPDVPVGSYCIQLLGGGINKTIRWIKIP